MYELGVVRREASPWARRPIGSEREGFERRDGLRVGAPDVRDVGVQLDCIAVGIFEVDAVRHRVVGDHRDLDAEGLEARLRLTQLVGRIADLERNVEEARTVRRRIRSVGPTAMIAKSWWLPSVKNVIGGASLRAAIGSPRTSV